MGDPNFDGQVDAKDALWVLWTAMIEPAKLASYNAYAMTPFSLNFEVERACWWSYENGRVNPRYVEHYYVINSDLVSDVDDSGRLDARDALWILKKSVDNTVEFPRTDYTHDILNREKFMFSDDDVHYLPWLNEWYPGKYYAFDALGYPADESEIEAFDAEKYQQMFG